MTVESVQIMVNYMQISNKMSTSEFINWYKDITQEVFNDDISKETADEIPIMFDGNISGTTYKFQKTIR